MEPLLRKKRVENKSDLVPYRHQSSDGAERVQADAAVFILPRTFSSCSLFPSSSTSSCNAPRPSQSSSGEETSELVAPAAVTVKCRVLAHVPRYPTSMLRRSLEFFVDVAIMLAMGISPDMCVFPSALVL